ncbi:uncharacterized protein LOC108826135 [Raphanus sativus]|uniref:Uncharacterized protein LOC108826135 n=1 Tax=Raphanus sativus TaxID=3726 RepID=A0A6J0L4B5_RAPSA|nr:uncharacterized protein LOC108826135 [Raphanus sativus]
MDVSANNGLELNGGIIRNSSIISRMVVEGYDTSPPRKDVEEALKQHFASHGIKLMHASVPVDCKFCKFFSRRRALIYVNGECEAEALKLDGSDMGGRILKITAYPFDDNSLEHDFAPTELIDEYRPRKLKVTGFGTSLSRDDIKKMLCRVFPGSTCVSVRDGSALLHLRGPYAMDEALKLSGGSVEGFKFAVTKVLPEIVMQVGIRREDWAY